ncbi:DUF6949 family protein [Pararhizobium sp. PWRC1-1]|uniref:DUF6949 family protein n=1 Tax=Pararhizobium sp. PWRC1-1 TaxID=2804566 RepID=UPI003CFB7C7B
MNIATFLVLLVTGFSASFLVLDISRVAARRHWPVDDGAMAERFRLLPVLLALFAGPALFAGAIWRMRMAGTLSLIEVAVAGVIAVGWACCYGLVVAQCVGLLFPDGPMNF